MLDDRGLHDSFAHLGARRFRVRGAIENHRAGESLEPILDNEIVLINDDGSVQSKADFLGSMKTTANNSQEQQVSPESMSVHVFGNTAISTGVFRAKGVEGGKSYVRRERFVDTWLYKNGKWVCVASNATPVLH